MITYVITEITFSEIPDEISLCINLSNCPHRCKGCHSKYLQENIGYNLTPEVLENMIKEHKDKITCICFMGGDNDTKTLNSLAAIIKDKYKDLKIGWYSGNKGLDKNIELKNFDYIKIGAYIEKLGPINKETSNQKMYEVLTSILNNGKIEYKLNDITYKYRKNYV